MRYITFKVSEGQWMDFKDEIESAIEEMTELSKRVEWYVTDLPDRLTASMTLIEEAKVNG